jgi:hypothetical protein
MGLLYGRAGRLNTENGGFRPGQSPGAYSELQLLNFLSVNHLHEFQSFALPTAVAQGPAEGPHYSNQKSSLQLKLSYKSVEQSVYEMARSLSKLGIVDIKLATDNKATADAVALSIRVAAEQDAARVEAERVEAERVQAEADRVAVKLAELEAAKVAAGAEREKQRLAQEAEAERVRLAAQADPAVEEARLAEQQAQFEVGLTSRWSHASYGGRVWG